MKLQPIKKFIRNELVDRRNHICIVHYVNDCICAKLTYQKCPKKGIYEKQLDKAIKFIEKL